MLLDRSLGDPELMGDAGVRAALGHEREHLALARREDVERVVGATGGDELLDERWIDDRRSLDDPLERLDELVHVGHAALQQVAAALAAREQVRRLLDLDVRGENEDRGLRKLLADHAGGIETFGRVAGRHPDVDDRELGSMLADERDAARTRSPHWPTTSKPERSSRPARPSRRRTSSSARTTRVRLVAHSHDYGVP